MQEHAALAVVQAAVPAPVSQHSQPVKVPLAFEPLAQVAQVATPAVAVKVLPEQATQVVVVASAAVPDQPALHAQVVWVADKVAA